MKLDKYLEKYSVCILKFAKKHKIAPNTLYRALRGSQVSLRTSLAITKATEGAVSLEDLVADKNYKHAKKNRNNKHKNNASA